MPEDRAHPGRWDISTAALVIANALPVVGVLFLRWKVFPLILLYWLENVVVGAFNVLRLAVANPKDPAGWLGKLFFIPFFCIHYGMFIFVHGVLLFAFFGRDVTGDTFPVPFGVPAAIRRTGIEFAVLAIVVSHGVSFLTNYIRGGEYQRVSLQQLMHQPYNRVVVLHMAILGGGFAMMALGSPMYGLLLLIVLKTATDIAAHRAERKKLAGTDLQPARTRRLELTIEI